MRNVLKCSAILLLSFSLFAQTAARKPASLAAPKPAADAAKAELPAGAPTQAMAEAYFKRVFGYDSNLQVRILDISLSPIPEMYEITALFSTPEGQQASHWYVSKDLKHAIAGDVLPFGADPFAMERERTCEIRLRSYQGSG